MLTARAAGGADNNYERFYVLAEIDGDTLFQAKEIFKNYHFRGVIINENFEDNVWVLTNQLKKMTFPFRPNELAFNSYAKKWLGCSYHCFVDAIKAYAVFHLGSIELSGIREIVRKLTLLAETPCEDLPVETHIIEFLKLLPGGETMDQVIEDLEERSMFIHQRTVKGKQRVLADFDNYFRFNHALEDYWEQADDCHKLFYFPMHFWWILTAILPLRPTEFLLTPRDCVERKNGENVLTIRRTALKGGQRKVFYNIAGDYRLMKYSIPDKMAAAIEWYREATAGIPVSSLDTLFVQNPHYSYFCRSVPAHSVYYTYQNLSYCLRRFQDEVIKVESDNDRINLGDTRHLAMISLIASGGSPVICRELAGHEDINISSHYYSNISRFVECATYEMYRRQKGGYVEMLNHTPALVGETIDVVGGRCDSAAYIAGSISDCIGNIGAGGEIGQCDRCPHFIDGKTGLNLLFSDTGERKRQVDEDSKYLMRMLEMVRKGRGSDEDIQSALLKLQHSSSRYSQCLYKNMGGLL